MILNYQQQKFYFYYVLGFLVGVFCFVLFLRNQVGKYLKGNMNLSEV